MDSSASIRLSEVNSSPHTVQFSTEPGAGREYPLRGAIASESVA
jgi:hypothetical protein